MHVLHTGRVGVVTDLPFDQIEPSRSMQHMSGNPVRIPKLERDFSDSEWSFTRGFINELWTDWWRIIINNILPLPECIFDYFFKLTLNHQGQYNSKNE